MEKQNKQSNFKRIRNIIGDVIYYVILIPLIIITLMVVYQSIAYPDKIPNIFGYKLFMILDDKMDETVEYGDLVFTKNIDCNILKKGNIIAFRNGVNTVTIHEIIDIEEKKEIDQETNEEKMKKTFTMQTATNETLDTKYVEDEKVEGILVKRIAKIGTIIMFIQKPIHLLIIIAIILVIGAFVYFIAAKLDKRDMLKMEEIKTTNQTN